MESSIATISYEEFLRLSVALHARSLEIGDAWELRTSPQSKSSLQTRQYLVKKATRLWKKVGRDEGKEGDVDEVALAGDTSCLVEESDVAYLDRSTDKSICRDSAVHIEYHVLHSVSYQVPVLYFNAAFSNGRSLVLEDIWGLLSPDLVSRKADRWKLVTQQEHPYLGRPFYHIHPCHTATVMGKAMQCFADGGKEEGRTEKESGGEDSMKVEGETTEGSTRKEEGREKENKEVQGRNYLITWLSTFAPVIGLDCSLKYASTPN